MYILTIENYATIITEDKPLKEIRREALAVIAEATYNVADFLAKARAFNKAIKRHSRSALIDDTALLQWKSAYLVTVNSSYYNSDNHSEGIQSNTLLSKVFMNSKAAKEAVKKVVDDTNAFSLWQNGYETLKDVPEDEARDYLQWDDQLYDQVLLSSKNRSDRLEQVTLEVWNI